MPHLVRRILNAFSGFMAKRFFSGTVKIFVTWPEEFYMKALGFILKLSVLTILAACASQHPKGQIVRLDPEKAKGTKQYSSTTHSFPGQQVEESKNADFSVPGAGEDAAVFYFSLGQAYSLDNEPQKAIEAYRATLVHDPKSALVHARLAAELVKIGSYPEAKSLCQKAIELDSKYLDSYLLLAGIDVAAKEFESALVTYQKALQQDPKNRDALLYYGVTLAEVGKVKEGIVQLEKLIKLKDAPDSNIDQSVAFFYLAKLRQQANQTEKAMAALMAALEKRPGFSKAALLLAEIYFAKKQPAMAIEVLEEAFKESHSTDLAERLAEHYLEKNDFKGAVVYLETLVEEDPSNENMKLRLALVYWQLHWTDKATMILTDLHARYPSSSEILFYLGELELEKGNIELALKHYYKISQDYAKYDQVVGRVVYLFRNKKELEKAETFLQNALQKRSDIVSFYPLLAALYEDSGNLEEAKLALERGLRNFSNDESILYYLGFVYDRLGQRKEALSTMERLLALNPENANALNFVGYSLLEAGKDLTLAGTYLERAVKLKPTDAFILDSYGWLLYRQGKFADAMKQLEKAHGLKPDEAVIAEHLADIYVALNMPNKAIGIYQKALAAGSENDAKNRVETKLDNVQKALESSRESRGPAALRQ